MSGSPKQLGRSFGGLRRRDWLVFALAVLAPSLALWIGFRIHTGICLEDALITYRYAENLALGNGFAFNPGERVLGTSSPLHAILLAGIALLTGPQAIPLASSVVLAGLGQLAAFSTFAALVRSGVSRGLAALAALAFAVQPEVVVAATGGMETMGVLALMAGSLQALCVGATRTAVVLGALLVLARPDGIVWAGLVLLWVAWTEPRAAFRRLLLFALLLLPWLVFATLYFGSPVPHSVVAKRTVVYADQALAEPLDALVAHLRWFGRALGAPPEYAADLLGDRWLPRAALLAVFAGLWVAGLASSLRHGRRALLLLGLFPPLLCLAYFLVDAPRIYFWYLTPPLWCCTVLIVLGLEPLTGLLRDAAVSPGRRAAAGVGLAVLLAVLTANDVAGNVWVASYHRRYQAMEDGLRRRVGEWLAWNTPGDASVAMEAIGYQGTTSHRRVIDLAGLISPRVVRIHAESPTPAAAFQRVLEELEPDYLVLRSFEVEGNMSWFGGPLFESRRQARSFRSRYREVKRFRTPLSPFWGRAGYLTVFERSGGEGRS